MTRPAEVQLAEQLRALLLHRLPADQAQQLEEYLLLDEDFAEQLRDAENDLLDDYAAGRLSPGECADAKKFLLASRSQADRARVASALARRANANWSRRGRYIARFRWLAPLSGLVAATAAALVLWPMLKSPAIEQTSESAAAPATPLMPGVAKPGASTAQSMPASVAAELTKSIETVVLLAESQRGGSASALRLRGDAKLVDLQLEVPHGAASRGLVLIVRDKGGAALFTATGLEARRVGPYQIVEARLPRAALAPGERQIVLAQAAARRPPLFVWRIVTPDS